MRELSEKVRYVTPDGFHQATAYVHKPEQPRNLENQDGSYATDYPVITCGTNKHSEEPVALQWDDVAKVWRQLVLPEVNIDA